MSPHPSAQSLEFHCPTGRQERGSNSSAFYPSDLLTLKCHVKALWRLVPGYFLFRLNALY
jgi:hypothetical protein